MPVPRALVTTLLLAASLACAGRIPRVGADAEPLAAPARTPHVVVVSLDGLRPDAITPSRAPTLTRLMREGSVTLDARTILPSKTLPSHVSMLTGVPPESHGISWNTDSVAQHGVVQVPTVFGVARSAGLRTAALFAKAKLRHLQVPGTLDFTMAPSVTWLPWGATRMTTDAAAVMRRLRPHLLFVHVGEPDYAGHAFGWNGLVYRGNVRLADLAVRDLVAAGDAAYGAGRWTLIVTADHGGQRHDHGSADSVDVTIPWIAWGHGVRAAHVIEAPVRTMDTAATALWLLGVPVPPSWAGRPVRSAFLDGQASRP